MNSRGSKWKAARATEEVILNFGKESGLHFRPSTLLKQHQRRLHRTMAASTSSTSRLLSSCTCAVRRSVFRVQRSQIHTRPRLPYDIENGVQPFLSAQAVKGTAIDWQHGNLNKLNDLIRGTPFLLVQYLNLAKADRILALFPIYSVPSGTQHENQSVAQTVVNAAKSPSDALIFGHASEALNNGYFLSCLVSAFSDGKI